MRVSANVCRSVMHVDSVDRELSFETCIVNRKYTHDVTVRNHSEIPLTFNLNAVTVGALQEIEVLEVMNDVLLRYVFVKVWCTGTHATSLVLLHV